MSSAFNNWRKYKNGNNVINGLKNIELELFTIVNPHLVHKLKELGLWDEVMINDLKYYEGTPVIKEIKRISKPGRRVYSRATSIPRVMNGLGLAILSTPKGVMTDTEARKNNVGGEIICRVF